MRYSAEHKEKTRQAILDAAGRVFRSEGYGGCGIDALTKVAGVTNGAFYGHFRTKAEAFRDIVGIGLESLRDGILQCQADNGTAWLPHFVDFYLGPKLACEIGDACALPLLSAEVARSGEAARATYEAEFGRVVEAVANGLRGDRDLALAVLALLSGAATFARAVPDARVSDDVVRSARNAVLTLAGTSVGAAEPAAKRPRARHRASA